VASTITDGTTTLSPRLVVGYETARPLRNVIHPIVGATTDGSVAVTLRPAGLRTGTLTLLHDTLAQAQIMEALLVQDKVFTLADSDEPAAALTFVTAVGELRVYLSDDRAAVLVEAPFQEVAL